jgi:GTPase SAR1 family protein
LRCSVVIKVGMVGDSAIGKTSLMVKYVEGAFDEDYIQTLGISPLSRAVDNEPNIRRQFHGKNNQHSKYRNHVFNMGFRWTTRIRKHVASCV